MVLVFLCLMLPLPPRVITEPIPPFQGPPARSMIDPINIGTYAMAAVKDGYNMVTINGVVISDGATTYQNFELPRPAMAVTPNPYSVTVNPNEMYQAALTSTTMVMEP